MGHPIDLNHRIPVTTRVIAGKLAKGAFRFALSTDYRPSSTSPPPGDIQPLRGLDHSIGLALHDGCHLVFKLAIEHRRCRHQRNEGFGGESDRHRQILAARLGVGNVDGAIMLWLDLNAEPVRAFHLQAVNTDVLDVVVLPIIGIAADHTQGLSMKQPASPLLSRNSGIRW